MAQDDIQNSNSFQVKEPEMNNGVEIPKIIHFCWFSGDPFPVEVKECMESWKHFLPDYTIRQWTYEDAKSLNSQYVDDALKARKWAFAADVVRLYAIYTEGGVYMDTDILLMNRFEEFKTNQFVTFHECYHDGTDNTYLEGIDASGNRKPDVDVRTLGIALQAAFLMGTKGNKFCAHLLKKYNTISFDMQMIAPQIDSLEAENLGYRYVNNTQLLEFDTKIYPSHFMAPRRRAITPESFAVHRCEHSWVTLSPKKQFARKIRRFFRGIRFYGQKVLKWG